MFKQPLNFFPILAIGIIFTLAVPALAQPELPPSLSIEGYPDRQSLAPGEELALHTSTTAAEYGIEIVRLGAERKVVFQKSKIPGGGFHSIPENASSHGCNWPISFRMSIPNDWPTGYYQVTLRVVDTGGKYVVRNRRTAESDSFFVVRASEPGKNSKILLQLSTNTYNAYSNWGGSSLYSFHGRAKLQGNRVSFHRPQSSQFSNWEFPFVQWAEKNSYQLDYEIGRAHV